MIFVRVCTLFVYVCVCVFRPCLVLCVFKFLVDVLHEFVRCDACICVCTMRV